MRHGNLLTVCYILRRCHVFNTHMEIFPEFIMIIFKFSHHHKTCRKCRYNWMDSDCSFHLLFKTSIALMVASILHRAWWSMIIPRRLRSCRCAGAVARNSIDAAAPFIISLAYTNFDTLVFILLDVQFPINRINIDHLRILL